MNVLLTPELEDFVAKKVQSGSYTSADEVICEGLRLLKEHKDAKQNQEVNGGIKRLDILPVDGEDVLNWEVAIDVAPQRSSGSIEVALAHTEPDKPIPIEDPWREAR